MIRRFNMFPYKTFGGQVVAEDLDDGRVRYTLYPFPSDGDDSRTIIVDPKNQADQRAISQLHLVALPDVALQEAAQHDEPLGRHAA